MANDDGEAGEISGTPHFRIERAELLIDCDDEGSISFLTNAALLRSKTDLEFARLQSPSQMIKISFEKLEELRSMDKEEAMHEILN